MIVKFNQFFKNQRGQGMTEYVLIIILVAMAAIAAYVFFKEAMKNKIESEVAQRADLIAAEKKVAPREIFPCNTGSLPVHFTGYYQDSNETFILKCGMQLHVSCKLPRLLVDPDYSYLYTIDPRTFDRNTIYQAWAELVPVDPYKMGVDELPALGERTLIIAE